MNTTERTEYIPHHGIGFNIQAAMRYADRKWPVISLFGIENGRCTCGNPECNSPGKHPRMNWKTEASSDLTVIRGWLKQWWNMNMGIVTGEASGIFVLQPTQLAITS